MGTTYTAAGIIGVPLDRSQVMKRKLYKIGRHDRPETEIFNPNTGIKQWDYGEDNIEGFDGYRSLFGLTFVWGTDNKIGYVGFGCITDRDEDRAGVYMNLESGNGIEGLKARIKETLEPKGLWDESKFGLWVVLRCSY